MSDFTEELRAAGLLPPESADRINALDARAHVPLGREVHTLLYLGSVLILMGVGAAVKDHLDQLGPATVAAALALAATACFVYAFLTGRPFAPGRVEPTNTAFDYILYLGCGLVGIFFTYLEWKWKLLGAHWDLYLLASGAAFLGLAYRFDNRLVLAAGLLNLAGWLGLRTGRFDFSAHAARPALIVFGAAFAWLGTRVPDGELKPHFGDTYLVFGAHLALLTLLGDATRFTHPEYWVLLVLCAALGTWSMRRRRFDTFASALGYAYAASLMSWFRLVDGHSFDALLWTTMLSSFAVVAVLLLARARFKEDAAA